MAKQLQTLDASPRATRGVLRSSTPTPAVEEAIDLMMGFAQRTGLTGGAPERRCLWTDALAVCNFLSLGMRTQDPSYTSLALDLVDRVHQVLGRHRLDDERHGWLSGLRGAEAEAHPTARGLRIGKRLPERGPDEHLAPALECQRDGQYFHCLTKWMHALHQTAQMSHQPHYDRWARELARVAVAHFLQRPEGGGAPRLAWKMSIDLSRPLVRHPGQRDPVDGLLTLAQLSCSASATGLRSESVVLGSLIAPEGLVTADPLGVGELLIDAQRAAQVIDREPGVDQRLVVILLRAAWHGLRLVLGTEILNRSVEERVGSRELFLALGLRAVGYMRKSQRGSNLGPEVAALLEWFASHQGLARQIEGFWLVPAHRRSERWRAHQDVNDVVLATSLVPRGVLGLLW